MIMAPTMPLNVYCMALLTCIMRDHRMQLLKYIIQFNIISLTHWLYVIFIYYRQDLMRKMSQIRHAQPQMTDHPIMVTGMIDFAGTVQNFGWSCV